MMSHHDNETMQTGVAAQAAAARHAAAKLGSATSDARNAALLAMADALVSHEAEILAANQKDVDAAREKDTRENLIDRLMLTPHRIAECASALRDLCAQKDPIGEVIDGRTIAGGIQMKQVRVPLGVIGIIYEARPNVTVDAAGIAIKTGNAALLRGGSLAKHSNIALLDILRAAVASTGLPANSIQAVDASDRSSADEMMALHGAIDVLIPRGGAGLIASVVANSKVPVIETGTGNCHIYIHESANVDMARNIVVNAKCQRTSVCNAAESLLIDRSVADEVLSVVAPALFEQGVELIVDDEIMLKVADLLESTDVETAGVTLATEEDWGTEYLDLKMSVKLVGGVEEAVAHINRYGTKHSEAIITQDYAASQYFTTHVDAAAVYVNASTRFTDGGMFGLGAEIGISTQKLHARGPMGLVALTSTKYICEGQGQIR